MHNSVAVVVCCIVKRPYAEDSMGTYEKLRGYCIAEAEKRKFERCEG
jgi:hypothetical protein